MTVLCTVNNCHYWGAGNQCFASDILITSDNLADIAPDSFDAVRASDAEATPVETCMATACKTFVKHNDPTITSDQITKRIP